jgi:hypothetical protein
MNVVLWIGQGLLAVTFLVSGLGKSTQSVERMIATGQTAAKIVPLPFMRVAGVSELLGVLGVILPWLTGIAKVLTPVSALGFGVIMVMAASVHTRLREPRAVAINLVILAVAVLIAWGRFADLA